PSSSKVHVCGPNTMGSTVAMTVQSSQPATRNARGGSGVYDHMATKKAIAEQRRLADADAGQVAWRSWGTYLSERAWGTVREDYSEHGEAWDHLPHEHARSRAYRWNEDGMAGFCD